MEQNSIKPHTMDIPVNCSDSQSCIIMNLLQNTNILSQTVRLKSIRNSHFIDTQDLCAHHTRIVYSFCSIENQLVVNYNIHIAMYM